MDGLVVNNLRIAYNGEDILKGVSINVPLGQTLAVIGKSGCGKSTLLRAICALQPAKSGDVFLKRQQIIKDGRPLFEEWEIRRHVMMVAQSPSLIPHLTIVRNISLGLECVLGVPAKEAKERTYTLAKVLGIDSVLHNYPEQLSGGQLQRANLGRAIILQPEFLLLDEVTSSIDPETTKDVITALYQMRSLMAEKRQTCIVVTHHLLFARDFADRIIFLNDGINFEEGEAATFFSTASRPETINFIEATRSGYMNFARL